MSKSFFFDRFVMRRSYRELMISLEQGDKKIKELADHSGMAYQHLSSVLQEAQKEGIIDSKTKDHSLNFNLTKKGEAIKELCVGLKACIENWDEKTIDALNKLSFIKREEAKKASEPKNTSEVIKQPNDGGNDDGPNKGTTTKGPITQPGTTTK